MSTAVKVTVGSERIALRPGESADIDVTIQNASQVVEHFATSVVGLPSAELFHCEPDVVKLRPKEIGNVRLKVSLPERGGLVAGPYVLGVLVRSPYQREVSRCEELALEVQPAPALTMGVQPEVANGGKLGQYTVSLTNEGNTPLAVTLAGSDQENHVGFDFEPRELLLDPGMAAGAQITASCPPPLSGQEKRRTMTLRAHAGEIVVERPVSFVQRPRIAGGVMKVAGIAAALTLLAGASVGGALLIRDAVKSDPPPTPNAANQSQPQIPNANAPNSNQTSSAPPSSAAQPTTTPPTQPAPPAPPATGNQPVNTVQGIDFARDAEITGERVLSNDRYVADYGVKMGGDTQRAPAGCEQANAQSLQISRKAGYGSYLTSSTGADSRSCNNMPVRMDFRKPVAKLVVGFAGPGVAYQIVVQFIDGSTDKRTANSATPDVTVFLSYEAQSGRAIKSVTFSHVNPDPAANEPTVLKSLGFTPA